MSKGVRPMAETSLTVEEVRRKMATLLEPGTVEIEKRMLKRFAEAVGDLNPLYLDEEYAQKTKYGSIIMPPHLLCCVMMAGASLSMDRIAPFNTLDGGSTFEFYLPVKLGDRIAVSAEVTNITERQGKMGRMFFASWDTQYRNQRDELVAKSQNTVIYY